MKIQEKYLKDITYQNGLRDYNILVCVLKCIAVKAGQTITPSVITTDFNKVLNAHISHNTIKKYFEAIYKEGIVGKVERHYVKGTKAKLKNADHYYIKDMGLFEFLNMSNPFGEVLGAAGEEIYELAFKKTLFYNALVNLEYDINGGRVEYSIRSKKVGSKRVGQNIDFMTIKNNLSNHFVFMTGKQREALKYNTDDANEFLNAVSSIGDGVQVYVVDIWENHMNIDINKIKLIGFETAIDLIS